MLIPLMLTPYDKAHSDLGTVKCINMFATDTEYDAVSRQDLPGAFQHTSGFSLFTTIAGGNVVRGLFSYNNVGYAVIDNTFYQIDIHGASQILGTLSTTYGRIQIHCNGTQLWLVNCENTDGYTYTIATNTFAAITDADYPPNAGDPFISTDYTDGYGIGATHSGRLYVSALLDFSSWDPLQYSTPDYQSDLVKAVIVRKEEILLLGDETVEFWFNSGATFPFQRRSLTSIKYGIAAPFTALALDDEVYWLSRNELGQGFFVRSNQYQIERISTPFIEHELSTYTTVDDAYALAYHDQGVLMYHVTFPTQNVTWVYDVASKMWHQRQSLSNTPIPVLGRHVANNSMSLNGQTIIGDNAQGNLYKMQGDVYTENGNIIHRKIESAILQQELNRISFASVEIEIEAGQGLATGQGSDPLIGLQTSKDRGNTWSERIDISMGKIGEYKTRVKWTRLGQARYWKFRFLMTEPIPFKLLRGAAHGSIEGTGQQGRQ